MGQWKIPYMVLLADAFLFACNLTQRPPLNAIQEPSNGRIERSLERELGNHRRYNPLMCLLAGYPWTLQA